MASSAMLVPLGSSILQESGQEDFLVSSSMLLRNLFSLFSFSFFPFSPHIFLLVLKKKSYSICFRAMWLLLSSPPLLEGEVPHTLTFSVIPH